MIRSVNSGIFFGTCLTTVGSRRGLAGIVGISKAVLLLSEGRVGPAFDLHVKKHLELRRIDNVNEWIGALQVASRDIQQFEAANQVTLQQAAPQRYAGFLVAVSMIWLLAPVVNRHNNSVNSDGPVTSNVRPLAHRVLAKACSGTAPTR